MTSFQDLVSNFRSRYTALCFDVEEQQVGTSCREIYHIGADENIIFYSNEKNSSLIQKGFIATDRAIYIHPDNTDNVTSNAIALTDLCGYLFYQETSYDSLYVISPNASYAFYKAEKGTRNEAGRELLECIHIFQKNLIDVNPTFQISYNLALGAALNAIRCNFADNGVLSIKHQHLLNIVDMEGIFPVDVCYLRAENLYRSCDMSRYYSYLDEISTIISPELMVKLKNPEKAFLEDYIRDISNPYALFLTRELIYPYSNLKKADSFTVSEAIILAYLCIRMEDYIYLSFILNKYSKAMGEKRLWEIKSFQAKLTNEKMAHVYNSLISGKDIGLVELNWQDSLGFTTLHYALLLRNWENVEKILTERDWSEYSCPISSDSQLKTVYDFTFLAANLYQNKRLVEEIFLNTSKMAKPLKKSIEQIDKMIYINQELGRTDLVEEYQATKLDIEGELQELADTYLSKAEDKAEQIRQNGSPFAKFILNIYDNADGLFHILTGTIADWRIYKFNNRYFLTTFDTDLPYSFYEWMNQIFTYREIKQEDAYYTWTEFEKSEYEDLYARNKQEERTYRHYSFHGGAEEGFEENAVMKSGWFSDAAYSDISVLKKEYRVLVKKYHPDNTNENTSRIFQSILNERADILASMN